MQSQYPATQQQTPLAPEQVEAIRRSNKLKLIWGLICLIAPLGGLILTILIYAIVNFISASIIPEGGLPNEPSVIRVIANVILFIVGAVSTMTILPGLIVGVILIATRKPLPQAMPTQQSP